MTICHGIEYLVLSWQLLIKEVFLMFSFIHFIQNLGCSNIDLVRVALYVNHMSVKVLTYNVAERAKRALWPTCELEMAGL